MSTITSQVDEEKLLFIIHKEKHLNPRNSFHMSVRQISKMRKKQKYFKINQFSGLTRLLKDINGSVWVQIRTWESDGGPD